MIVRTLSDDEVARWDAWLPLVKGANVRQLSTYRTALALYGYRGEVLVVESAAGFTAGALLAVRRLPLGLGSIVSASGGLALADPADVLSLQTLLDAIVETSRDAGAWELEVSLRLPSVVGDERQDDAAAIDRTLTDLGFERAKAIGTYFVELREQSEEALLARFGKNPRRHIRKAQREGLVVEPTLDPADFEAFGVAHAALEGRKGLAPLPPGFSSSVLLPIARSGLGALFVARFRGTARNYLFVGDVAMPIYQWGALTEAARESDCPQTGQALHYAAMLHFRARGRALYDFGGSPGPVPEPGHSNFSVWKFKHEFAGTYVSFVGSWTAVPGRARSRAVAWIRRGRGAGRRLFHR